MAETTDKPPEKKCDTAATADHAANEAAACKLDPKYAATNTADAYLTDLQLVEEGTSQTQRNASTHEPLLSGETLTTKAQVLDDVLHRGFSRLWNSRDAQEVANLFTSLNQDDLRRFEAAYNLLDDRGTLREELRGVFSGSELARLEAVLDKKDGQTNFGGNREIALSTAYEGDPAKAGEQLRAMYGKMTAADYQTLAGQWTQNQEGELGSLDKSIDDSYLSDVDKYLLRNLYNKPLEERTAADLLAAAKYVVNSDENDFRNANAALRQFADVIGGNTPAAIEARRVFRNDPEAVALYNEKFAANPFLDETQQQIAADYLREGRISLATTITGDTSTTAYFFGDEKNIEFNLANATPKERADFQTGRLLAAQNPPPSPESLSAEQQEQLKLFNTLNENFLDNGGENKAVIWADVLANGRRTIVSDLAQQREDGTLTNEKVIAAIEGISAEDWALLKAKDGVESPLMAQLKASILQNVTDAKLQESLTANLEKMIAADSHREALQTRRSFEDAILQNAGPEGNAVAIANAVMAMTPADAQRYKNDPEFRSKIDAVVFPKLLPYLDYPGRTSEESRAARVLAASMLSQVGLTGEIAKEGPVEKLAKQLMAGELTEPHERMQAMHNIMQDPGTLALLQAASGKSDLERSVLEVNLIDSIARLDPDDTSLGYKALLEGKQIPLGIQMFRGQGTLDGFSQYSETFHMDAEERAWEEKNRSPEAREIQAQIDAQNGVTKFEDELRMYAIGQGLGNEGMQGHVDYRDMIDKLGAMNPDERAAVIEAYETKYAGGSEGTFKTDFLAQVGKREGLDESYQKAVTEIANQGFEIRLEDQIRLQVLDGGEGYKAFAESLNNLSYDQREKLKDDYRAKYASDLDNDFLGLIPNNFADQVTFANALRPSDADPVQDFLDRVRSFDDSGVDPDGTQNGMLRALQINGDMLAQYAINREKLPPDVKLQLDKYFDQAVQNNLDSKDRVAKMAEAAMDVVIIAAALATLIPSEGASSLAIAAAVGTATARVPVISAIKGDTITQQEVQSLAIKSGVDIAAFTVFPAVLGKATAYVQEYRAAQALKQAQLELALGRTVSASPADEMALALARENAAAAEAKVLADARAVAEAKAAAELKAAEEARVAKAAEDARIAEEARVAKAAEDARIAEEARVAKAAEDARIAEEARVAKAAEDARIAEEARVAKAAEDARIAEEARVAKAAEDARIAEEARVAKAAEDARIAEEARVAAEAKSAAELKAAQEARVALEEAQAQRIASARAAIEAVTISRGANAVATVNDLPDAIENLFPKKDEVLEFTPPPTPLPSDALIDMATVRRGEGPWQSAERILAADGKPHSVDEVRALTKAIQAVYKTDNDGNGDMSGLKVKYNFVTKDNFDDLLVAVQNDDVKAVLMGLAQGSAV
jgi:hypothetical protein